MNLPSVIPYGYRRITAKLKAEHWAVNRKRVQRLWRAEGLKVPTKTQNELVWGRGERLPPAQNQNMPITFGRSTS